MTESYLSSIRFGLFCVSVGEIFMSIAMVLLIRKLLAIWHLIDNLDRNLQEGIQTIKKLFAARESRDISQFIGTESENSLISGRSTS